MFVLLLLVDSGVLGGFDIEGLRLLDFGWFGIDVFVLGFGLLCELGVLICLVELACLMFVFVGFAVF